MSKRWYVARTQAGLGKLAEDELKLPWGGRPGFECFRVLHEGRSVFGPYIFIHLDLDSDPWWMVNGVRGVQRLLPLTMPFPIPVRQTFIDEVLKRQSDGGFNEREAERLMYEWSKDDVGIVTAGAWQGHSGPFSHKRKGFVNLSMVVFGRAFDIPIPEHQVRPASPDERSVSAAAI